MSRFGSWLWVASVWCAGLLACSEADRRPGASPVAGDPTVTAPATGDAGRSMPMTPEPPPKPAFVGPFEVPPAVDPRWVPATGVALRFRVANLPMDPGLECKLAIRDGETVVRSLMAELDETSCAAVWDGRTYEGLLPETGVLTVEALLLENNVAIASAKETLEIVEITVTEVVPDGDRLPLLFRAVGGIREGFAEYDEASPSYVAARELAGSKPEQLAPLPIWENLVSPPTAPGDGMNLPTAWTAGGEVAFRVSYGVKSAGVELIATAPPGTLGEQGTAEGVLTIRYDESPVPHVGRYDITVPLRFEARRSAEHAFVAIPGEIPIPQRLYGLVGPAALGFDDVPHRAWLDVVDTVAEWVDGATHDPELVAAEIVRGVYYDLGLEYDVEDGASAYTEYPGRGYEDALVLLSWFQDRSFGNVINCSDAASIVGAYAGMVGVDLKYHILLHRFGDGFDLNYIQAIGAPEFTETPFVGGRGGFRYHAVTGSPAGTIYDATLALDGDGEPETAPFALWLVQGIVPEDYVHALSSEWRDVGMYHDQKVRIR